MNWLLRVDLVSYYFAFKHRHEAADIPNLIFILSRRAIQSIARGHKAKSEPEGRSSLRQRTVIVQNALGEAAGELFDIGGAAEVALFGGVRDETDFDQCAGTADIAQHLKARPLHPAVRRFGPGKHRMLQVPREDDVIGIIPVAVIGARIRLGAVAGRRSSRSHAVSLDPGNRTVPG